MKCSLAGLDTGWSDLGHRLLAFLQERQPAVVAANAGPVSTLVCRSTTLDFQSVSFHAAESNARITR